MQVTTILVFYQITIVQLEQLLDQDSKDPLSLTKKIILKLLKIRHQLIGLYIKVDPQRTLIVSLKDLKQLMNSNIIKNNSLISHQSGSSTKEKLNTVNGAMLCIIMEYFSIHQSMEYDSQNLIFYLK